MATVTEKIHFTDSNEIVRNLPTSLSGKMPLQYWNKFCDDSDKALSSVGRIKIAQTIMWVGIILFGILASTGWYFSSNIAAYYGIVAPITFVLFMLSCHVDSHQKKAAASKIRKLCAGASNQNKYLTMTLKGTESGIVSQWYIEVAFAGGAADIENPYVVPSIAVSEPIPVVAVEPIPIVAVASAVPVVPVAKPSPGPAPKKYVKDETTGKMTLNPEYTKWKQANE